MDLELMRDQGPGNGGVDYIIFNSNNGETGSVNLLEIFSTHKDYDSSKFQTILFRDLWVNDDRKVFGRHFSSLDFTIYASSLHSNTPIPEVDILSLCSNLAALNNDPCVGSSDRFSRSLYLSESKSCSNLNLQDTHERLIS